MVRLSDSGSAGHSWYDRSVSLMGTSAKAGAVQLARSNRLDMRMMTRLIIAVLVGFLLVYFLSLALIETGARYLFSVFQTVNS